MIQIQCTEHLWGNMVLHRPNEPDKHYVACVNCGVERVRCTCPCHEDKSITHFIECCEDGYIKNPRAFNFHIEKNLDVVKNSNTFNAEKYLK